MADRPGGRVEGQRDITPFNRVISFISPVVILNPTRQREALKDSSEAKKLHLVSQQEGGSQALCNTIKYVWLGISRIEFSQGQLTLQVL